MDIRCPKCGEPWEIDSLHDELDHRHSAYKPWKVEKRPEHDTLALMDPLTGLFHDQKIYEIYFNGIYSEFKAVGCNLFNVKHSDTKGHPALLVIAEMLGDDVDAYAGFIEDNRSALDEE